MQPPTVDRFRYPFRKVIPGDPHTIVLSWSTPIDLSGNTYSATMVDAVSGAAVTGVAYVPDMTNAAVGVVAFNASIPIDIDTTKLNEIRVRKVTPTAETLIAGYVCYPATAIAGVA